MSVRTRQGREIDDSDRSNVGLGRTALVTGASSGIGRSMSQLLAAKGFDVVLVARREGMLRSLATELDQRWGRQGVPLVADLSQPTAMAEITTALDKAGLQIDFLVNNAGYGRKGRYLDFPWEEHEARLRVMGLSTLELTHRLLPGMLDREWGRIVNVSSFASLFTGTPSETLYSGTKAMIVRFSESLDAEYRNQNVRCTASLPGATDTEIFSEASGFKNVREDRMLSALLMSPHAVTRQAFGAVMGGRPQIVHGVHHKTMALFLQHTPLPVRRRLAAKVMTRS